MFDPIVMCIVTVIFSFVHIMLWQIFPKKIKHMIFAVPVLAFIIDFLGSGLITEFTGIASFVGICNMGASVIFGFYAVGYGMYFGIKGVRCGWYHLFGIKWLPWFPRPLVVYEKDGRTWTE